MTHSSSVLLGVGFGLLLSALPAAAETTYHHMHLAASSVEAGVQWYSKFFDCKPWLDRKDGCLWLLASRLQGGAPAPTEGRAIDHLSWEATDLDAEAAAMKKRGVTFREEPHALVNQLGQRQKTSVLTGPDGVRIDLVEPQA